MNISDLVYIDSTGYHYPDYPTTLAWLQDQYRAIYGADVYLGNDSQDGQFLAVIAQALFDTAALGSSDYSSFSPATAQGVGLSRVVKINGIVREVASHSTAELVVVGVAFTTITNGIAYDTQNQQWALPATVVIPFGGSITVTATAVQEGSLQAPANSITGIQTPTKGWQTVNNPADATPGAPVESDAQLRARQAVSTANPSLTVLEGSTGAIRNLPGVQQVQPYENDTGSTDGNGIPAHTVSFVVKGGDDVAIAEAIALHKTPGVGTYGTTTETVTDANGVPLNINFYRPTNAEIGVEITLKPLPAWITSNEDIIKAAVSDFINNIPIGGENLGGGNEGVSYSQIFGVAYVPGTSAAGSFIIEQIRLKKNAGSFAVADISLLFNESALSDPSTDFTFIIL